MRMLVYRAVDMKWNQAEPYGIRDGKGKTERITGELSRSGCRSSVYNEMLHDGYVYVVLNL